MAFPDPGHGAHEEPDNHEVSRQLVSRRRMLALAGLGVGAGLGAATRVAGPAAASPAVPGPASRRTTCVLTSEAIEGPYYLDYELVRRDVREDRPGVPMVLDLTVVDAETCRPLRGAAVEIWHCDALGVYSGYDAAVGFPGFPPGGTLPTGPLPTGVPPGGLPDLHVPPTNDLTFLRGMQFTDRHGGARFVTVFPGWYAGRAIHIHTKVHLDGRPSKGGYEGGTEAHTGQIYVDETAAGLIAAQSPYSTSTTDRVKLEQDILYPKTGARGGLLALRYDPHRITRGVHGRLTMGVDGTPGTTPTTAPTAAPTGTP